MPKIAVVTGAGAGVGRAVVDEFARNGFDVGLLSRDPGRLEAAASAVQKAGRRSLSIPTDVADDAAVERAAALVEQELGPIDVWVNVAMATVFSPVSQLTGREIERSTQVTYLGQVYGMLAALKRMRPRNKGVIVNVGSALAYRAIPLQAPYCGAKFAIRGFTDALRSELLHDNLNIHLTEVDLPAVNTPQFDWSMNKTGKKARPVPPVFQPEVAARAIYFAATHRRRQVWVGFPTLAVIVGNWLAPILADRRLADGGYRGQLTQQTSDPDGRSNLFASVSGAVGAHGRFDSEAKESSSFLITERHRAGVIALIGVVALFLAKRASRRRTRL